MSVVVIRCRRSFYKKQRMLVVAEEDLVNHEKSTSRNGQASRCRHCCTSPMTEADRQSSQQMHMSEYPNDAWASRVLVSYFVRIQPIIRPALLMILINIVSINRKFASSLGDNDIDMLQYSIDIKLFIYWYINSVNQSTKLSPKTKDSLNIDGTSSEPGSRSPEQLRSFLWGKLNASKSRFDW